MDTLLQPFDRHILRLRRDRVSQLSKHANFLFIEAAEMLADRLSDIRRAFPRTLILGGREGTLARTLHGRGGIETLFQTDLSPRMVQQARVSHTDQIPSSFFLVVDEEFLPFAPHTFDLVLCPLNLHWVNDLPGTLAQIRTILKPDGLFLANMLGGETLTELRHAWMEAEIAIEHGAGIRVSPFADLRDAAGLLQRAGFALPVADSDTLTIQYQNALSLMRDIQKMGESNNAVERRRTPTRRETLMQAASCYADLYATPDGHIPATFQILTLTGWAPDSSQPKPLRPGSATTSLSDALSSFTPASGKET